MTKTEKRRQINERFYQYVNNTFPKYSIDNNEGGGRVYLINEERGCIEYSQSEHTVCCLKMDGVRVNEDCKKMEIYIQNNIIPYVQSLDI
jgi:hypothetical protein